MQRSSEQGMKGVGKATSTERVGIFGGFGIYVFLIFWDQIVAGTWLLVFLQRFLGCFGEREIRGGESGVTTEVW